MTIQIELSPLMVAVIEDQLSRAMRFDENNKPVPIETSVSEWVAGLIHGQLEAVASASRHPEMVAHRQAVEASRQVLREALFPRRTP